MKKILMAFILLMHLLIASDEWWDWDWHYRFPATFNATGQLRKDWIVEVEVNFSQMLGDEAVGKHLDEKSIRVVEYEGEKPLKEVLSQYDSYDEWGGELIWLVEGDTKPGEVRKFYVYFDILEHGEKEAPVYPKGVVVQSRREDIRIDTAKFMIYIDRRKYGFTHIVRKPHDWANVVEPRIFDPLKHSRENITRYRGFLSRGGEHFCDPGCQWRRGEGKITVVHEGPLRATILSISDDMRYDDRTENFTFENYIYVYKDKNYYRVRKVYRFDKHPQYVEGMNRWMWIFTGSRMKYAYESVEGVKEGTFPSEGTEFKDWAGTWEDTVEGGGGIANLEMSDPPIPRSLWIEYDERAPASYVAALWRPGMRVDGVVETEIIHYLHDGNWRDADIPGVYRMLREKPKISFGNLSNFLLRIDAPSHILNWNPSIRIKGNVESGGRNITIVRMKCRMYNEKRTIYEGEFRESIGIFNIPEGVWNITCVAEDEYGRVGMDTKQVVVYDVVSLLAVCGGIILCVIFLTGLLFYRLLRVSAYKGKVILCPRCGMRIGEGAKRCPVCGRRLK